MEPVFGFLLFAVASLVAAVVAQKRGRSGVLVFVACLVAGFLLVKVASGAGADGTGAALAGFAAPVAALFWALSTQSSPQLAVSQGEHGEFKKCPFCAESVRKEAIKCRHCGSTLEAAG